MKHRGICAPSPRPGSFVVAIGGGVRRNAATISQAERDRLLAAFLKLDTTKLYPDGMTYWDKQEEIHKSGHAGGTDVHSGPATSADEGPNATGWLI